jgi:hypothetical protein
MIPAELDEGRSGFRGCRSGTLQRAGVATTEPLAPPQLHAQPET